MDFWSMLDSLPNAIINTYAGIKQTDKAYQSGTPSIGIYKSGTGLTITGSIFILIIIAAILYFALR